MADILIRGISLPEDELKYVSLWIYGDGRVYVSKNASAASSKRLQDLAIPLPEGHGRLGDLDKLEDAFIRYYLEQERNNNLVFAAVEIKQRVADMIGDWPTIVPAEGGEEDG